MRCAAVEMESQGYFATAALASGPRWKSGSTYVFGLDLHGNALFNGDPDTGVSELTAAGTMPFGGRDVVSIGEGFGEAFLYYQTRNPSTGMPSRKVALVKRVVIQGIPALIGSGYYPEARPVTMPPTGGSGDGRGLQGEARRIADRGETATLLYWQAPTILNPYLSSGSKDADAASIVIEPLARYNPDGELVAVLATRVPTIDNGAVSDDRTQITWRLRDGVVWSDGTPLTAGDVVFTWQYCTAPGSGCAGASRFENVASIEAVDESTVTITFVKPTAFPYVPFVSRASPVLQASQFADCIGPAAAGCSAASLVPIGTGPYTVAKFGTDGTIHYRFNPLFRNIESGQPYFSDVILKGGGEAADAARSVLELGEADFAWNLQVEPDLLATLSAGGRGTLVSSFALTVERLVLNQTNPDPSLGDRRSQYADGTNPHPFLSDPVVGRALSLAIDREVLAKTGYGELAGRPTCNIWPAAPVQSSPDNTDCPGQNINLAQTLLDNAGIVDSDGDGVRERNGIPLRILFRTATNSVRQAAQERIKSWWAQLGVETELEEITPSVFFGGDVTNPNHLLKFYADIQMFARGTSGLDPASYMGAWTTEEIPGPHNSFVGLNVQRFQSDEYDRLYTELRNTTDVQRRNEVTIALNDMLVQSYSVIPLVHRGSVSAYANDIEGVWKNAWDSDLWNIETWTRRK